MAAPDDRAHREDTGDVPKEVKVLMHARENRNCLGRGHVKAQQICVFPLARLLDILEAAVEADWRPRLVWLLVLYSLCSLVLYKSAEPEAAEAAASEAVGRRRLQIIDFQEEECQAFGMMQMLVEPLKEVLVTRHNKDLDFWPFGLFRVF